MPHLVVVVGDPDLTGQTKSSGGNIKREPGGLAWVPAGVTHTLANSSPKAAQFVTLEFKPVKP
ncbi:MAG: hypothetical protein ACHP79_14310 [Terriglobales bacterium]